MTKQPAIPASYPAFLEALKQRIQTARTKAALAVNRELVLLYWSIGRDILAKQKQEGWGSKIIERLSLDLRKAFPGNKGFARSNLFYMRAFAEAYPDEQIVQEVLGQLPWYHHIALLDKLNGSEERLWYARQTIENGWSRNVLVVQIERDLYGRLGKAQTNFDRTLPEPQSDLAQQLTKDTYSFDFLDISLPLKEKKLERALLENILGLILELGKGFAFVGSQYHLAISGKDFYLDLLFYHYKLHCFVVFELKAGEFKPEYAGKMNFYLSAVDDQLRSPEDNPSIGIILCKERNKVFVEYALRDYNKPMSVAEFKVTPELPDRLQGSLPTAEEINAKERPAKKKKKS